MGRLLSEILDYVAQARDRVVLGVNGRPEIVILPYGEWEMLNDELDELRREIAPRGKRASRDEEPEPEEPTSWQIIEVQMVDDDGVKAETGAEAAGQGLKK